MRKIQEIELRLQENDGFRMLLIGYDDGLVAETGLVALMTLL